MGCNRSKEDDFSFPVGRAPHDYNEQEFKENEADEAASVLRTTTGLCCRVQLSVKLSNLVKLDKHSNSDPIVIAKTREDKYSPWIEIGRTEIIANNQNPEFITKFKLDYHFEEIQYISFEAYDVDTDFSGDTKNVPLHKQDFQGGVEVLLSQIVGADGRGQWSAPLVGGADKGYIEKALHHSRPKPHIHIRAEEQANVMALVTLELRAVDLEPQNVLKKSDPFLRILRANEDGTWTPCFKTEVKRQTNRPKWNVIHSSVQLLSNGDFERPLQFQCLDYHQSGSHELIGMCEASLSDLTRMTATAYESGAPAVSIKLVNRNKSRRASYSDSGRLYIEQCTIVPQTTFLDYIHNGADISFIVAIDFTASNGDPNSQSSLHYHDKQAGNLNQYAQAIAAVGEVVEFYDSDKKFPVYGFGAKLKPGHPACHCFAANGDEKNPDVHPENGYAGVLQTYYETLNRVTLSGPTLFSGIIRKAAKIAEETQRLGKYYVLLIITDGIINDMANTIDAIIGASSLPLSILIVGVGNADFSNMKELDCDGKALMSRIGNQKAARDIVQFTQISNFENPQSKTGINQKQLTRDLLAEIPSQFLAYVHNSNITVDHFKNIR